MPLSEKGEKIKSAMEKQYGEEKGESVFYASKNKGTITGVDAVPCSPAMREKANKMLDSIIADFDTIKTSLDSIMKSRYGDAFEEAKHPRNAGGVFTTGEGEEAKEKKEKFDSDLEQRPELRQGQFSKDQ